MQNIFKYAEIIDLVDFYQNTFIEKAPSLKKMPEKIVGKKCTNINNAPFGKIGL